MTEKEVVRFGDKVGIIERLPRCGACQMTVLPGEQCLCGKVRNEPAPRAINDRDQLRIF